MPDALIRITPPDGDCIDGDELTLCLDTDGRLRVYNGYHFYEVPADGLRIEVIRNA